MTKRRTYTYAAVYVGLITVAYAALSRNWFAALLIAPILGFVAWLVIQTIRQFPPPPER